MTMMYLAVYYL